MFLDRGSADTQTRRVAAVVDANPNVSHEVRWTLSGDTASVVFDAVLGTVTYRCLPKSGNLTLTATAVADSTIAFSMPIVVQGHPAATGDPPCS